MLLRSAAARGQPAELRNMGFNTRHSFAGMCQLDANRSILTGPSALHNVGRSNRGKLPTATPPPDPGGAAPVPGGLPIPGTSSVAHLEDNMLGAGIELTDAEFADLSATA